MRAKTLTGRKAKKESRSFVTARARRTLLCACPCATDRRGVQMQKNALAVLAAILALSTPVFAQSFLGTMRGTVVDPQGQVVPGATVLIIDEATGTARTLETDAEGRY